MFKRIRRKLAAPARKVTRRHHAYSAARHRSESSSSDGSPRPDPWKRVLPKERGSPPQPGIGDFPDARVKKLATSWNIPQPQLDSDIEDRTSPGGVVDGPALGSKCNKIDIPQCHCRAQSASPCQQEAEESLTAEDEAMKFITLRSRHHKLQALLVPQLNIKEHKPSSTRARTCEQQTPS